MIKMPPCPICGSIEGYGFEWPRVDILTRETLQFSIDNNGHIEVWGEDERNTEYFEIKNIYMNDNTIVECMNCGWEFYWHNETDRPFIQAIIERICHD